MVNSGPAAFADAGQGGERHHVPVHVAHEELAHVLGAGAVVALRLHVNLPLAAEAVEVVHKDAAHEALERLVTHL